MAGRKQAADPHFEVAKLKFPLISSDRFKQGDVKLIAAVTGMEWDAWCKLLAKHGLLHAPVTQGFFAVALQRARNMTLEEVEQFIDDLPLIDGIKLVFPKTEGDALPPAPAAETAAT
jgi:hypothetical protein